MKQSIEQHKSLIGLLVLCLLITVVEPNFLKVSNITNILTQVSVNAIIAVGMTFVILTGGIDLSVGSILAISGAIAASTVTATGSATLAVIAACTVGVLIGLANGLLISKWRLQAFIATLATMTVFRGVTLVYTGGIPISRLPEQFVRIGNAKVMGIPVPIIISRVVAAIGIYVLSQTRFGRYLYALGGNEDSARLSGINITKVKTMAYVISGFAAAVAGIIVTSRIGSASPNAGAGF